MIIIGCIAIICGTPVELCFFELWLIFAITSALIYPSIALWKWKTCNLSLDFNGSGNYSPLCLIFKQDSIGVKSYVCFWVQSIDRIEELTNVSAQLESIIDEHSKHFIAPPECKLNESYLTLYITFSFMSEIYT